MGLKGKVMMYGSAEKNINLDFTYQEIDIIIRVLGTAQFPVKDIESLYRAIFKLQELRKKLRDAT